MKNYIVNLFKNWKSAIVGIGIAAMLIFATESLVRSYREYIPSSYFFEVNQIYVPDHTPGSNPPILYDRTIKRNFFGTYTVEVQRLTLDANTPKDDENGNWNIKTVCVGKGSHTYTTSTTLPSEVTWEWYIDRPCYVPIGRYRLQTTWTVSVPNYPNKIYVATSNIFNVIEQNALQR